MKKFAMRALKDTLFPLIWMGVDTEKGNQVMCSTQLAVSKQDMKVLLQKFSLNNCASKLFPYLLTSLPKTLLPYQTHTIRHSSIEYASSFFRS